MVSMDDEEWFDHYLGQARFDDQAAPIEGTSAGLEANKVVNDESTYDNDARDQVNELKMNVLVNGKQDEAKVVKVVVVAVEQNINEPDVVGEKNATPGRSKRIRSKPAWQKDYAM
nr:hypothetical protein [Tanacetum cinerariifolium]